MSFYQSEGVHERGSRVVTVGDPAVGQHGARIRYHDE